MGKKPFFTESFPINTPKVSIAVNSSKLVTRHSHVHLSRERHPRRHLDHLFITVCSHLSKFTAPYKYG